MISYLLVFIGGGFGSVARFGIAKLIAQHDTGFPWATFAANIISCIILGFLLGYQIKSGISNNYKLLLMTGFCGGFSTFSTFSAETFGLLEANQFGMAFLYIGGSILVCLLCIFIGLKLNYLS
jgi:CrcB protein